MFLGLFGVQTPVMCFFPILRVDFLSLTAHGCLLREALRYTRIV